MSLQGIHSDNITDPWPLGADGARDRAGDDRGINAIAAVGCLEDPLIARIHISDAARGIVIAGFIKAGIDIARLNDDGFDLAVRRLDG